MVTVTKREAVQALIRGSIRALKEGDDVCALALASLAEAATPRRYRLGPAMVVGWIRDRLAERLPRSEASSIKAERDWLSHHIFGEPPSMAIEGAHAVLVRAASRYLAFYGFDDLALDLSRAEGFPFDVTPS